MAEGSDRIVLVAEDQEPTRDLIASILGLDGFKASLHENGRLLLKKYLEKPDDVGLVITDTMMPEMDGLELIRTIRGKGYVQNIIGMSGIPKNEKELIGAGANYFIQKPFKIADFSALVKTAYR